MKQLHTFFYIASRERRLLVSAALLLWVIKLGLWLLPFQTLRRLLACVTYAPATLRSAGASSPNRIAWAVTTAGRYVPQATCLTQALATQVLLTRWGAPARLCIGVAKVAAGELQAHAWVESEGRVVVGGSEPGRFTPLLALDGERP